jgi:hypothetical protein
MLRNTFVALALSFAFTAPTFAASPSLDAQKAEMKDAKKHAKDVDKAVGKWLKGSEKGNDDKMARAEADLDLLVAAELRRLRTMGIPTVEPEPPVRPEPTRVVDGDKVPLRDLAQTNATYRRQWLAYVDRTAPEPSTTPALDAYRDQLVELRDLQAAKARKPQDLRRMGRLLEDLDGQVERRAERAEARYDAAKR